MGGTGDLPWTPSLDSSVRYIVLYGGPTVIVRASETSGACLRPWWSVAVVVLVCGCAAPSIYEPLDPSGSDAATVTGAVPDAPVGSTGAIGDAGAVTLAGGGDPPDVPTAQRDAGAAPVDVPSTVPVDVAMASVDVTPVTDSGTVEDVPRPDPCSSATDCVTCTARASCGWCAG